MKISLIMPIFNAEKRMEQAIDSVLMQTYHHFELILIDDGSTDQSKEICKSYARRYEKIEHVSIENSGPGAARNVGLECVTGDYISFIDADDFLEADFLERMVEIVAMNDFDIVSSNYYQINQKREIAKNNYQTGIIHKLGNAAEQKRYDLFKTSSSFGYVWGKLYKTSFIEEKKLKFSEERKVFLEDTLFNLKAIAYHPNYYVLNEPLYNYNVYEGSVSNKKEDITERVLQMLEDYEFFLDTHEIYEENLDLLIPLTNRVIAWSLFKTMDKDYRLKNIYKKIGCFSRNKTIQRAINNPKSFQELRRIDSRLQTLLYSFMTLSLRFKMKKSLALFFYLNFSLFSIYIRNTSKA